MNDEGWNREVSRHKEIDVGRYIAPVNQGVERRIPVESGYSKVQVRLLLTEV